MNDQLIPLTGLYENTSQKTGKKYYSGVLGRAKILLLENKEKEEGKPGWTLFIAERQEKRAFDGEPHFTS